MFARTNGHTNARTKCRTNARTKCRTLPANVGQTHYEGIVL